MTGSRPGGGLRGYVALSLAWLVVLGGALFFTRRPAPQPIEILPPPTTTAVASVSPASPPTPGPLQVDVAGAVKRPGVYALPPGSMVVDAIAAAGGTTADAEPDRLNKAERLQDGMQVYVPQRDQPAPALVVPQAGPGAANEPATTGPGTPGKRLNINTATAEELDALPGVGPATALKIIEGRPYGRIEDILRVDGIAQATFEKLREHISVE